MIPAGKERAFQDKHKGTEFLTLPTSEMLRFLSSDPEISAQQSPRSRYQTVTVHRSIFTESRSFSANSSALDKGKSISLKRGKFELHTLSIRREINRNPPAR